MTQPIKQIVEEFEKLMGLPVPQKVQDFLTTSLTKLIESDIEWLIEQRISYLKSEEGTSHGDYGKGYNQALSDIITYKRSQLNQK